MEIKIQCPGYEIAADWYDGTDPNKILIVLPGYSSKKSRQIQHVEAMVTQAGTSAIVVDFSGHGNSPFNLGDTRPAQHFLELICVFDWLKLQYPQATVSLSGGSYGGFLAVQLTKYREFKNLILRAPAIYRPSAFYDLWSLRINNKDEYEKDIIAYRSNADELARHPLLARAASFEGNTLVVAHENDELVPRQTTDAYVTAFKADTSTAEGFMHRIDPETQDLNTIVEYQNKIAEWLNVHS